MEESFDAEGSFDDASCLSPQSPGSTSPARRQNKEKEIKETKITVSIAHTTQLTYRRIDQMLLNAAYVSFQNWPLGFQISGWLYP